MRKVKFVVNSCKETTIQTKSGEVKVFNLNLLHRRVISEGGIKTTRTESYFMRVDEAVEAGKEVTLDLNNWAVRSSEVADTATGKNITFKWIVPKSMDQAPAHQEAATAQPSAANVA